MSDTTRPDLPPVRDQRPPVYGHQRSQAAPAGSASPTSGPVRVRGRASGVGGKIASVVLAFVPAALALAGGLLIGAAQARKMQTFTADTTTTTLYGVGVALVVVAALLLGLVCRVSSLGPTLLGLVLCVVGVLPFFVDVTWPGGFSRLAQDVLGVSPDAVTTLLYGPTPLLLGAGFLAASFAASLVRRAPRRFHPDSAEL